GDVGIFGLRSSPRNDCSGTSESFAEPEWAQSFSPHQSWTYSSPQGNHRYFGYSSPPRTTAYGSAPSCRGLGHGDSNHLADGDHRTRATLSGRYRTRGDHRDVAIAYFAGATWRGRMFGSF